MTIQTPDLTRLLLKLVGKREDLLRRLNGDWRIARRKIVLDQSVL